MNRRRFIPSTEGLEVRTLQATNLNTLFGLQLNANLNIPITYQQRVLRIRRLPYYLEQIRPGRFLPKAEMQQIQSSLYNMLEVIHRPPTQGLDDYNYDLRKVVSKQSLTVLEYQFAQPDIHRGLELSPNAPRFRLWVKYGAFIN